MHPDSGFTRRLENSLSKPLPTRPNYAQENIHLKALQRISNHISGTHPKVSFGTLSYACKETNEIKIERYFERPGLCDQQVLDLHLALAAHEAAHLRWTSQHSFVGWGKMIHNGLEDVRINAILKKTYLRVGELLDFLYRISQIESQMPLSPSKSPSAQSAIMCIVLYLQEYPYEWTIKEDQAAVGMFDLVRPSLQQIKHDIVARCDENALFRHVKAIRRLWRPFLKSKKPLTSEKSRKNQANTSMFDFAASGARSEKDRVDDAKEHLEEEIDLEAILSAFLMEESGEGMFGRDIDAESGEGIDGVDESTLIQAMERLLCEEDQSQTKTQEFAETVAPVVYRARKQDDVMIAAKTTYHPKKEEFLHSMIHQERMLQVIADSFEQESRWEARTKNGLLDSRRLAHTALRERDVFRKRTLQQKTSTAFSILIDASGSMYRGEPEKIDVAIQTAFVLCLLAQRLDIVAEALAFTTIDFHAPHHDGYERSLPLKHVQIKGFEDHLTPEPFLHAREEGGFHNVDGEALEWAAGRLIARNEQQKLLLVLSDGHPAANQDDETLEKHLEQTIRFIKGQGIRVFGFGIQSEHVQKYYQPLCVTVQDINLFTKQGFVAFLRLLLER